MVRFVGYYKYDLSCWIWAGALNDNEEEEGKEYESPRKR